MARYDPLPDIPLQYGRPSSAALGIAGATNLAAAVADYMGKKRDEDAAAQGLVPYLQSLDNKTQGAILGKLATENPGLFQKVASMLQPAGPDPVEAAKTAALFDQIGYNPNSSAPPVRASAPPPSSPLGMLGGPAAAGNPLGFTPPPQYDANAPAAPTPPGFSPLPTAQGTAARISALRAAFGFGDASLATAAPAVSQANVAALNPQQQALAVPVETKIAPTADVVTQQAGENYRTGVNAATTKYTHDNPSGSVNAQIAAEAATRAAGVAKTREETAALARNNAMFNPTTEAQSGKDVRTTVSGAKYADLSGYTGKARDALKNYYQNGDVPTVDNRLDADALRQIDTARLNQNAMLTNIEGKLPKDAAGRIVGGTENRLSQLFQTDADLASFGAYRSAAIQALRATAGSGGLRINQQEIKLAIENDIPKITDTVATARAKSQKINELLSNGESSMLTKDRSKLVSGGTTQPQAGGRQIDAATAQRFLVQAGGDKAKARQLAAAQGYKF